MNDTSYLDRPRILLVEDDTMIASGLIYALESEGYAITHAANIIAALTAIQAERFDLAILDVGLPDGNGFDLHKKITSANPNEEPAVIFLTVVDDEGNIVKALDSGAQDYITKPFRLRELLARVKVVLRRRNSGNDTISLGKINIHTTEGKAYLNGASLNLTALEYRLLLIFANNQGRILSRTAILDQLWDHAGNFVEDNTLTVYIKRLREKIGDAANIETIRAMGYKAQ
ncbi:MAG: response regulator transcription factor [Lachnospiraceae bacterium]|jgi:DNA-binding response OmpR family regulator|nr:response regulator transcription factor [Lachnospiraceae bacterium]